MVTGPNAAEDAVSISPACVEEIGCALSILAQELLAMHRLDSPPRLDFRPRGERSSDD
ncbi:hypothetical protein [Bradyrhizobium cytisi]|uniref:hypothetical protein n=1 Tax=Bradyrhizobium cytisi TaxID=515489 RepID=UPI001652C3A5|nr:hypothetical protein [Bradyrhizobium cytisi]